MHRTVEHTTASRGHSMKSRGRPYFALIHSRLSSMKPMTPIQTVATTAKAEATPVITDLVRRLFRAGRNEEPKGAPGVPPVTPEQARRVREVALARASDLGLPEDQARLLADSVVGGLVTAA